MPEEQRFEVSQDDLQKLADRLRLIQGLGGLRATTAGGVRAPSDGTASPRKHLEGGAQNEDELVAAAVQILTGGYESLRHMISLGLVALMRHPAEIACLRADPRRIAAAVEELLRYDGVVQQLTRIATAPLHIGRATIAAGDAILLLPGAGNHDPSRFAHPHRLDLHRRSTQHLAFGVGSHACPGAGLARTVARITLTIVLARFPSLELRAPGPVWEPGTSGRGLLSAPVSWTPA